MTDAMQVKEAFRCNCPHEVRSGCSDPKCPHYVVPRPPAALDPVTVETLCETIVSKIYPAFEWKGEFSKSQPSTHGKMKIVEIATAIRAVIDHASEVAEQFKDPERLSTAE